jgi:hypothetical protein
MASATMAVAASRISIRAVQNQPGAAVDRAPVPLTIAAMGWYWTRWQQDVTDLKSICGGKELFATSRNSGIERTRSDW